MSKRRERIAIPAPLANYGQRVLVLNYRMDPPQWEEGELCRLSYQAMHGPRFSWHYSVWLNREDATGRRMWRYVGDDGIKLLEPADDSR